MKCKSKFCDICKEWFSGANISRHRMSKHPWLPMARVGRPVKPLDPRSSIAPPSLEMLASAAIATKTATDSAMKVTPELGPGATPPPPGGPRSSSAAEASFQRIPDTAATRSMSAVPLTSGTGTAAHASCELIFFFYLWHCLVSFHFLEE